MDMENHYKKRQESRDWSNLPIDILEMFCRHLTIRNQLQFGCVCKPWLSCTTNKSNIWVPETPWLIDNDDKSSQFQLYSNTSQKIYKIYKPFKPLHGSFIVGSSKGWLVIRTLVKLFVLNPLSKLRIQLPSETTIPCFLSSKALYSGGKATPITFAISTCAKLNPTTIAMVTSGGDLAWCNIGDEAWKGYRPGEDSKYGNLIFYDDKIYAINRDGGKVDIFKINEESLVLLLSLADTIDSMQPYIDTKLIDVYLVESGGRVLVVKRYYSEFLGPTFFFLIGKQSIKKHQRPTTSFVIYEVQEKYNPPQLVKVDNLEDHVLFLSDYNIESLHYKHCPELNSDSIYFFEYPISILTGPELWEFSVINGTMCRMSLCGTQLSPVWILPRFVFECDYNCKCNSAMWIKPKRRRGKTLWSKTNVVGASGSL